MEAMPWYITTLQVFVVNYLKGGRIGDMYVTDFRRKADGTFEVEEGDGLLRENTIEQTVQEVCWQHEQQDTAGLEQHH